MLNTPIYLKAITAAARVDMPSYGTQDPGVITEFCHARISQDLYVCADLVTFDDDPIVQVTFYNVPPENDHGMYSETLVRELTLENASEPFFMVRSDFENLFIMLLSQQEY